MEKTIECINKESVFYEVLESLKISKKLIEKRLKWYYGLTLAELPEVNFKDKTKSDPLVLAFLLIIHGNYINCGDYFKYDEKFYEDELEYEKNTLPGIRPEADRIVQLLDVESFKLAMMTLADKYFIASQRRKQKNLALPFCKYADEEMMREVLKRDSIWKSKSSGSKSPTLYEFRNAVKFSNTYSAMLFADKYNDLKEYAEIRGMTEDEIRDMALSDSGLDADGRKVYNLGNQKVTAILQKDISLVIETAEGKLVKSMPKRGSEEELYAIANKDFKQLCSNAKKIVRNRVSSLFKEYLSGKGRGHLSWKNAYIENPLLRSVAEHIVWCQGKNTFTVSGKDTITVEGAHYELKNNKEICVAHPIEMTEKDVCLWQEYFSKNKLPQPFEQIWEPIYKEEEIHEDRYKGTSIFWRRVQNVDKHGIHFIDENYHGYVGFELEDCELEHQLSGWLGRHWVSDDARFELGKFKINKFSRKANHIIYLLDKWTILDRIKKDDIKVMDMIEKYTIAQIMEFINIAVESESTQLTAALMAYKEEKFKEFDAFDAFTLELL